MFCQEWSLVKHEPGAITIIPLRCHCWSCDECRPDRVLRLIYEAKRGRPDIFITLTSIYTPGGDPGAAAVALSHAWRKVRTEFMKENGLKSLPFLAVFEETLNGWPHLHIVARCKWISQKWLSKRMGELTGAFVVGVERLHTVRKIANYITKYIGKNPYRFTGTKRYWRSQDYFLPDETQDAAVERDAGTWKIVRMWWLRYVLDASACGFDFDLSPSCAILTARAPP